MDIVLSANFIRGGSDSICSVYQLSLIHIYLLNGTIQGVLSHQSKITAGSRFSSSISLCPMSFIYPVLNCRFLNEYQRFASWMARNTSSKRALSWVERTARRMYCFPSKPSFSERSFIIKSFSRQAIAVSYTHL